MRQIAMVPFVMVAMAVTLFFGPRLSAQGPQDRPRDDRAAQSQRLGRVQDGSRNGRGERSEPGRRGHSGGGGGFPFPPPPVLMALDQNKDGVISADELNGATAALKTLDKNNDGEVTEAELRPNFGRGGFPFAGRRGGFRGRRAFRFREDDASTERLDPEEVKFEDGAAHIPDHATFHKLSYKGEEVMIDTFLAGLEFVKFTIEDATAAKPLMYFMNTKTHRAHMMFGRVVGLPFRGEDQMKGVLVYRPRLKSPRGKPGLCTFEFEPFDAYPYKMVKIAQDLLIEKMPILKGKLGYYPRGDRAIARYEQDKETYENSDVSVYFDENLTNTDVAYLPLNLGETFGRLRLLNVDERPGPRDVVLYKSLPNELPRVAGIMTAVRQTPLSHVNLRAIQNKIPNAFVTHAAEDQRIAPLIGRNVYYSVTADGFEIREATIDEVEAHFADLRPSEMQVPKRDLSVTTIRPLDQIKFEDSSSVGVKAANVATMHKFGLPEGTVPDGAAIPFYFYEQFMKHNGFYRYAADLVATRSFQQDRNTQKSELKKSRKVIKRGKMPSWMMSALDDLDKSFPQGISLRCRSSTNNEDLPGFSGAGLYDSFTHHPDEGHLSKSIKQVYASLWNFRAFEERDFYRVDHFAAAMGVLVHPNLEGEMANGVAVTDDILYETEGNYYLNTQIGEDLVTNPGEASIPEEILLDWWSNREYEVVRLSNRADGKQILTNAYLGELRAYLGIIHGKFARLYGASIDDDYFAMEVEFKITREGVLSIKQARPWVHAGSKMTQNANEEPEA